MGEKDITEKILEDYNDIFSDIVNVLLFDGEQRVEENSLVNVAVHSQYKDDKDNLHEQERDVAKYWKERDIEIALYGIENQTEIERRMPLRIFGYEGASYRMQFDKKKVAPVITLVLYFGTEKRWNSSRNLKDLIEIPEDLEDYVNDIHVNIFEVAWLSKEQIDKFTSDFRIVANFFANKRKNRDYVPDDKTTIKHVDELLKLLSAMTGDYRYNKILANREEVKNMCDVAQRLEDRGMQKGLQQGRSEGLIEGGNQMIYSLVQDGDLTPEKGAQRLGITVEKLKANMVTTGFKYPDNEK
ncbi:MAG: Rpn family recombination-promoting nuclease/putative transposase [Lachnospira sp.]